MPPPPPPLVVSAHARATPDALAAALVLRLLRSVAACVRAHGRCLLVVAGGSLPQRLAAGLRAAPPAAVAAVPWPRVVWAAADERFVPRAHADANAPALAAALAPPLLPLPLVLADSPRAAEAAAAAGAMPLLVPPAPADDDDGDAALDAAATAYSALLAACAPAAAGARVCVLGVGEDGHVASLFPGRQHQHQHQHQQGDQWGVLAVRGSPKPPPLRVTLPMPALAAAHALLVLATGAGKRAPLTAIRAALVPPTAATAGSNDDGCRDESFRLRDSQDEDDEGTAVVVVSLLRAAAAAEDREADDGARVAIYTDAEGGFFDQ